MGRKAQIKEPGGGKGLFGTLPAWADMRRIVLGTLAAAAAVAAAMSLLFTVHEVRQFLLTDQRFILSAPPEFEFLSPDISVTGARNALDSSIHAVFQEDFGHSIYLMNLEERRLQLRNVEWVKDATVTRLWPNRIAVHIMERTPVAFVEVPAARRTLDASEDNATSPKRFLLIDEEGYILRPKTGVGYKLPIVKGIGLNTDPAARRSRVRRMMAVMDALEEKAADVVEVDVADANDVRIRREMPEHSVTLLLGNRRFKERVELFDQNYRELRKFLPAASILDLRLEDRITEVHDGTEPEAAAPVAGKTRPAAPHPAPKVRN